MKKIISFIIALMILTSVVCSASGLDNLKSINVTPESFTENTLNEYVTRAEFAYMAAKILSNASFSPKATRFADVAEDNIYSGYIEFLAENGIITGTEGAAYMPDNPVDINMANKIVVCALGFGEAAESRGGYPVGYNTLAQSLKLYKSVETKDGYLTRDGAISIIEGALLSEVPDANMIALNGEFTSGSEGIRLFCDVLGYSAYKGKITKVDYNTNEATFNVTENLYSQNKNILEKGKKYIFGAVSSVNIAEYERLPVTIWVNEDSKIINVIPDKKTEVKYAYIESVNGNSNKNAGYIPGKINEIVLVGEEEEYLIHDSGLEVKYNNVDTSATVKLCGRFARMVLIDGEISFVESWDIKEGGLITNVGNYDISYIQGEKSGFKLKEAVFKKNLRVFIDNNVAGYKDLRENSVFDYYETKDSLVIIASEKVFTEEFKGYSSTDEIEIGNLLCKTDGKVYFSTDGVSYKENQNEGKLFGRKVCAYVAPNGYVKYMSISEGNLDGNSFYGIVLGVEDDEYEETAQILMYKVQGSEIEKGVYDITKKTKYLDTGLNIDELKANGSKISGECLYKFETNGENRILTVSRPELYHGPTSTSKKTFSTDTVPDTATPNFSVDSKKVYFEASAPITYIYKSDGEICVASFSWETIRGKQAEGATLRFYGNEKETEYPEFLLMSGGNDGIYKQINNEKYGIYTGYTKVIDSQGDERCMIRVITPDGERKYSVDHTVKNQIETATGGAGLIKYYTDSKYSGGDNEILYVSTALKLSEHESKWEARNTGLKEAVIDRILGQKIIFESGEVYYLTGTARFKIIVSVDEGAKVRFKNTDIADIMPGDRVYYYLSNGEIYNIYVLR